MLTQIDIEHISNKYLSYVKDICTSLIGFSSEDAADDIAQEVFVTLMSKREELTDENIRGWLYKTAYHKCQEHFTKKQTEAKRFNIVEVNLKTIPEVDLSQLDRWYPASDETIIDAAEKILNQLSETERELYRMLYCENISYTEVAEIQHTSANCVRVKALKLRQKLHRLIQNEI